MLAHAAGLFAAKGYANTLTSELGRASEFSEGRYFIYFGSKDGVLRSIFDDYWAQIHERVHTLEKTEPDPVQRIRRITRAAIEVYRDNEDVFRVVASHRYPSASGGLSPECAYMREFHSVALRAIEQATRQRTTRIARKTAEMIYHSLRGALEHLLNRYYEAKHEGRYSFTIADVQQHMDVLVNALLAGAGESRSDRHPE
jgi:AcrR family transcriptional regulator